jgi:hypothetical protein
VLESPVFLPIGLVRLLSAEPLDGVVATTAATPRTCPWTLIPLLATSEAPFATL